METTNTAAPMGATFEGVQLSRNAAGLLSALRSLEQAKSDCFGAFADFYGEGKGATVYADALPQFDLIQGQITAALFAELEGREMLV